MPSPWPIWKEAPFLRLLPAFASGIIAGYYLVPPLQLCWLTGLCLLILLAAYSLTGLKRQFRGRFSVGVLILLLVFVAGSLLGSGRHPAREKALLTTRLRIHPMAELTLTEHPVLRGRWIHASCSARWISTGFRSSSPLPGRVRVYLAPDPVSQSLESGSRILVSRGWQDIRNNGNPGSFDYAHYAAIHAWYSQLFLRPGDYRVLPGKKGGILQRIIVSARGRILSLIRKKITGPEEAGLAEALLIGYKEDLDDDLYQAYSKSGVVHVIAISGLHLGLIYAILLIAWKPFQRMKLLRKLRIPFLLGGLWAFALLTGSPPSVLRSAVMFSFLALGNSRQRKVSSYNSLAVAAFLLLCYYPLWLWDIGFQLSFCAVLSILLFSRPFYLLWQWKSFWADRLWKFVSVTLAAQVLSFPLVLYHFHQFPTLFLFSNVVAVPLASLILCGEVLLCLLGLWPAASTWLGWLLRWLIRLLNRFTGFTASLPFSSTGAVYLNSLQIMMLYGIVICLSIWLAKGRKKALALCIFCLSLFLLTMSLRERELSLQHKIIIYRFSRITAVDFISGGRCAERVSCNRSLNRKQILERQQARQFLKCRPANLMPAFLHSGHLFSFRGKRLLLLDSCIRLAESGPAMQVDLLLLGDRDYTPLSRLLKSIRFRKLILSPEIAGWKARRWKQDCNKMGLQCYSVVDKGAFVINLP